MVSCVVKVLDTMTTIVDSGHAAFQGEIQVEGVHIAHEANIQGLSFHSPAWCQRLVDHDGPKVRATDADVDDMRDSARLTPCGTRLPALRLQRRGMHPAWP